MAGGGERGKNDTTCGTVNHVAVDNCLVLHKTATHGEAEIA